MAKQVYLNQIEKKLTELQRERKQVLQHLVLVDEKIATLHQAIDIMQAKSRLEEHNTKLYSYRTINLVLSSNCGQPCSAY